MRTRFFFFNDTATTEIYTLSLHDALPIYSTSGGHLPGDEVIELPQKTKTKKWQGYPPENSNVVGKGMPALPEDPLPRFTGKDQYTSGGGFTSMLDAAFLTCPHPLARIKNLATSAAEENQGVRPG